jgi:hypothetical protein
VTTSQQPFHGIARGGGSGLEHGAELEQVADAGLDLDAAREPGPAEIEVAIGQGDQVVAADREPHLRLRGGLRCDPLDMAVGERAGKRDLEVGYEAAHAPVERLVPVFVAVDSRQPRGQSFQRCSTLLIRRHEP